MVDFDKEGKVLLPETKLLHNGKNDFTE